MLCAVMTGVPALRLRLITRPDKRLSHMPTPEEDPLSYITVSQLTGLISNNWNGFGCYFPPENI